MIALYRSSWFTHLSALSRGAGWGVHEAARSRLAETGERTLPRHDLHLVAGGLPHALRRLVVGALLAVGLWAETAEGYEVRELPGAPSAPLERSAQPRAARPLSTSPEAVRQRESRRKRKEQGSVPTAPRDSERDPRVTSAVTSAPAPVTSAVTSAVTVTDSAVTSGVTSPVAGPSLARSGFSSPPENSASGPENFQTNNPKPTAREARDSREVTAPVTADVTPVGHAPASADVTPPPPSGVAPVGHAGSASASAGADDALEPPSEPSAEERRLAHQRRYLEAYGRGITAVTGAPWDLASNLRQEGEALGRLLRTHAKGPDGKPLRGEALLTWLTETAEAYATATRPAAQFQRGFVPSKCLEWLSTGRPSATLPVARRGGGRIQRPVQPADPGPAKPRWGVLENDLYDDDGNYVGLKGQPPSPPEQDDEDDGRELAPEAAE